MLAAVAGVWLFFFLLSFFFFLPARWETVRLDRNTDSKNRVTQNNQATKHTPLCMCAEIINSSKQRSSVNDVITSPMSNSIVESHDLFLRHLEV